MAAADAQDAVCGLTPSLGRLLEERQSVGEGLLAREYPAALQDPRRSTPTPTAPAVRFIAA